jgi:two-component system LytT family response regulator
MRIILCDDDNLFLLQLKSCLSEYFDMRRLAQPEFALYPDGKQLLDSEDRPDALRADLAFLDVEMPGVTGIDAGARLMARNPYLKIFIITSYADYLDDAMRFHVFRYLSKPLDKDRLFRNLKDALHQISADTRRVVIDTPKGSVSKLAHEILMVEAQGRLSLVYTVDGPYESTQKMALWEHLLDTGSFYKIHRSFLVNMKYVSSFSSTMLSLIAPDGTEHQAYMARRHYKGFKEAYIMYVEAMR